MSSIIICSLCTADYTSATQDIADFIFYGRSDTSDIPATNVVHYTYQPFTFPEGANNPTPGESGITIGHGQ